MNFKQTVLNFFPWIKATESNASESNVEPAIAEVAPKAASQPPVTMSFYATKSKKIPGRRSPAGSR